MTGAHAFNNTPNCFIINDNNISDIWCFGAAGDNEISRAQSRMHTATFDLKQIKHLLKLVESQLVQAGKEQSQIEFQLPW